MANDYRVVSNGNLDAIYVPNHFSFIWVTEVVVEIDLTFLGAQSKLWRCVWVCYDLGANTVFPRQAVFSLMQCIYSCAVFRYSLFYFCMTPLPGADAVIEIFRGLKAEPGSGFQAVRPVFPTGQSPVCSLTIGFHIDVHRHCWVVFTHPFQQEVNRFHIPAG